MRTEEHQKQRKGAIAVMETLISLAPKIRAPIQLAGFLFATLAVALIQFINPSDKQAMIVAGLLGVVLVALALLFHPTMIKLFPATQRAPLVLLTLLLIFSSFGALAYVTVASTYAPRPSGARFDTFLEQKNVRLIRSELGLQKVELTWNFVPLSSRPENGATIFTGLVVLHDESKITKDGAGVITQSTCAEVPSCINSHYFRQMEINPLLVRSDSRGTEHTVVLDLKVAPKNLRIWWEFYQREGIEGGQCRFDNSGASSPANGIPPVAIFSSAGQVISAQCYRSFGQKTFEINL